MYIVYIYVYMIMCIVHDVYMYDIRAHYYYKERPIALFVSRDPIFPGLKQSETPGTKISESRDSREIPRLENLLNSWAHKIRNFLSNCQFRNCFSSNHCPMNDYL